MTAVVAQGSDLDEVAARRLTDQVRLGLDGVWELAVRAWEGRAWIALGYASWDEYCVREFGACRLRLPRQDRDEVLAPLVAAGMSARAIGSLTGAHHTTIRRGLARSEGGESAAARDGEDGGAQPTGKEVIGRDGRRYASRRLTKSDVLLRRAEVARLRNRGWSQPRIAAELDVAQATVSADLAELSAISGAAGLAGISEVLQGARDEDGRTDVGTVADYLGVETAAARDLGKLAKQPLADLEATLLVVLEEVVYSDEWLDPVQHEVALSMLMPGIARVVGQLARLVGALTTGDRGTPGWADLQEAISALSRQAASGCGS